MKKRIAILLTALLLLLTVTASAQTVRSIPSEEFIRLVAGKTLPARISGYGSSGEGEDMLLFLSVTICERERFAPELVESLKAGDTLLLGLAERIPVLEVTTDEYGVNVKGDSLSYSFTKGEDGTYTLVDEYDFEAWKPSFTVDVLLEKDIVFSDAGDPDAAEPVMLGFSELTERLWEGVMFEPYNTKMTFDGNGKLTRLDYTYAPWN